MQSLQIIFTNWDANALITIAYVLMTLVIGLFFSLSGPKIASTVLSGSPSMGAGDQ